MEPWAEIPAVLKSSAVGWNSSLAAQEQRITNDPGSFQTDDQLGTYIELGIHNWIHGATATAFNEPSVRDLHSPQSTYFYKIHGLVENWWRQWESGPVISPTTPLTVGAPPAAFSIGGPGEIDRYSFVVPAAGSYTIETQGPTDVVMSLYGPNNLASLVTEDDDSGAGDNARIVSNLTAGTYFVQVRHFNAGATGNYSISVRSGTISVAQIHGQLEPRSRGDSGCQRERPLHLHGGRSRPLHDRDPGRYGHDPHPVRPRQPDPVYRRGRRQWCRVQLADRNQPGARKSFRAGPAFSYERHRCLRHPCEHLT